MWFKIQLEKPNMAGYIDNVNVLLKCQVFPTDLCLNS